MEARLIAALGLAEVGGPLRGVHFNASWSPREVRRWLWGAFRWLTSVIAGWLGLRVGLFAFPRRPARHLALALAMVAAFGHILLLPHSASCWSPDSWQQ